MNPALVEQPNPVKPEQIEAAVKSLYSQHVEQEYKLDRATRNFRLRQVDMYHRGIQNIQPVQTADGPYDWEAIEEDSGATDRNFNIVRAYGRKYVPALATRPWDNCIAIAEDTSEDIDERGADSAQALAEMFKRKWNNQQLLYDLFHGFWTAGTQYIVLFMVPDAEKFGMVEEPQFEEQDIPVKPAGYTCQNCMAAFPQPVNGMCPECSTPVQPHWWNEAQTEKQLIPAAPLRYPRKGPVPFLVDGSVFTHPFDCKDLDKTPWAVFEVDEHPGDLLQLYGEELREKMGDVLAATGKSDSAEGEDAMYTRAAAASLSGSPQNDSSRRWRHRLVWMRPSMFEMLPDAAVRDALKAQYPDGVLTPYVNEHLMVSQIRGENIADRVVHANPECSKFVTTDPYALTILEQQDVINALMEMALAFAERKLPTTIVDSSLGIADYINKRRGRPTEVIETMGKFGRSINDGVALLTTPQGDAAQYTGLAQEVKAFCEFETSISPTIYGAPETQAQTAEAARNMLNQAIQTLAVAGNQVSVMFAKLYKKAVKLMVADADIQNFKATKPGSASTMIDVQALRDGRYDFEPVPGVPMSWSEKAQMIEKVISQNPQVATALKFDHPINAGAMRNYLLPGMRDMRDPMEDQMEYANRRIQELLQAKPIQPMADGEEPQSSVQPDEFLDDAQLMVDAIKTWACSKQGMKAQQENPEGALNVILHGLAQQKRIPPPPSEEKPKLSVSLSGELSDIEPQARTAILQSTAAIPPNSPPVEMQPTPPPVDPNKQMQLEQNQRNAQMNAALQVREQNMAPKPGAEEMQEVI